ncbi:MAG: dihydroneopterin aldolase [Caldimonas sp.]
MTVFVEDFIVLASIGIYSAERLHKQRLRFSLAVRLENCAPPFDARNVLDYNLLRDGVRAIVEAGHVGYQETVCEAVLSMCLALPQVVWARVKVAKLDAFADCAAVGCEMESSVVQPVVGAAFPLAGEGVSFGN